MLFFLTTAVGNPLFIALWAAFSDTPFKCTFSFVRRKHRKKEMELAGKIILGISAFLIALYYLACHLLEMQPVFAGRLLFVVLMQGLVYLSLSNFALRKAVNLFFISLSVMLGILSMLGFVGVLFSWKLDLYCGYMAIILLVVDSIFAYQWWRAWERGDLG